METDVSIRSDCMRYAEGSNRVHAMIEVLIGMGRIRAGATWRTLNATELSVLRKALQEDAKRREAKS